MVQSIFVALVSGFILTSGAAAKEGSAPTSNLFSKQIEELLVQAERLQTRVEKLEHNLEFPYGDQVAVYLSAESVASDFQIDLITLEFDDLPRIDGQFDSFGSQCSANRRFCRLLSIPLEEGSHSVRATVSGTDGAGAVFAETVERSFLKQSSSVVLELGMKPLPASDGSSLFHSRFW